MNDLYEALITLFKFADTTQRFATDENKINFYKKIKQDVSVVMDDINKLKMLIEGNSDEKTV